ncbi:MAG: glycoside hydrolase family 3 protein [Candidatus Thermochlorobacter sp.]
MAKSTSQRSLLENQTLRATAHLLGTIARRLAAVLVLAFLPLAVLSAQTATPSLPDSLDFKIGQMLLVGFRGLNLSDTSAIARDIKERYLGAVILFDYDVPSKSFGRNIESPKQVRALCRALQNWSYKHTALPLLIAIDQEGGKVARLKEKYGFKPTVSQAYLGALNRLDSTRKYARETAMQLAALGINLNFAPCVDVNLNPQNPIIGGKERSFSSDPTLVTAHARAVLAEHRKAKILTAIKHFPGHGSSAADSHLGLVDVTKHWQSVELLPFQTLIAEQATDMVMTAHIYNAEWDTLPATLSKRVLTSLLRDSLKFQGVIVSDDMQMKAIADHYGLEEAIKLALQAGVDMLTFGNNLDYDEHIAEKAVAIIKNLVAAGEISPERIDASYQRILALKRQVSRRTKK